MPRRTPVAAVRWGTWTLLPVMWPMTCPPRAGFLANGPGVEVYPIYDAGELRFTGGSRGRSIRAARRGAARLSSTATRQPVTFRAPVLLDVHADGPAFGRVVRGGAGWSGAALSRGGTVSPFSGWRGTR